LLATARQGGELFPRLTAEAGFAGSACIAAFRGILVLGDVIQWSLRLNVGGRGLMYWPGPAGPPGEVAARPG
jgi:hypothetical protein